MMPRAAVLLALVIAAPFLWGALTLFVPEASTLTQRLVGTPYTGPYLQLRLAGPFLMFSAGALWGFAARGPAAINYLLAAVPFLWALVMPGAGPMSASMNLIVGFVGLSAIDWHFWRNNLAPRWWLGLRLALAGVVILSLLPVVI